MDFINKDIGVKTEFNMSLATLERIHSLFKFINQSPLDPFMAQYFTPEKKFYAYMRIYEEVVPIMKKDDKEKFIAEAMELTKINNDFLIACMNQGQSYRIRAVILSSELNKRLTDFGIKIREVMQKQGLLFRESEDIRRAVLGR